MGDYNSLYENYYNKVRNTSNQSNVGKKNRKNRITKKTIVDKFIFQLIGTFILLTITLFCRTIKLNKTVEVYNISKGIINENYDLKGTYEKIVNLDFKELGNNIQSKINDFTSKLTGEDTLKEKIKSEYILPIQGEVTSVFGEREDPITKEDDFHQGIDINAAENTDVLAAYDGIVVEVGEDDELGKYILLDHGDGIETKYAHLNIVMVDKGTKLKKSEVIAKSGNTGKSTGPHLHFELLIMGENVDPLEYIKSIN
ncbi:MAG: M23 family metallopeptidase [Clostridiaceae bacterium]